MITLPIFTYLFTVCLTDTLSDIHLLIKKNTALRKKNLLVLLSECYLDLSHKNVKFTLNYFSNKIILKKSNHILKEWIVLLCQHCSINDINSFIYLV